MTRLLPSLLRPLHTDEFVPAPPHAALARAVATTAHTLPEVARMLGLDHDTYAHDRRATALALREIDAEHGGGFYRVPESAVYETAAANAVFNGQGPVLDVQTHLVDPECWVGPHAAALGAFLQLVDPERWGGGVDPRLIDAAAWAALIFGASETAIALLTSTPGPAGENVLENAQIATVREVTDRYAGTGRVLTHTIVHPNLGVGEIDRMVGWSGTLRPSAWKVYTLAGPPTAASPTGGWFLDDAEIGLPFLERVRALGPRIVCAHKGLGGPIPEASVVAASPRDIGPAAAAFPDLAFVVYHSGYERNPDGQESGFDAIAPSGVDRLIASAREHGIGGRGNVYAELGSTWFLMLRRPVEAAHVLGKLLVQFGPERILWGTDSTWYGSPQPLIDALRAFTIPEWMQEEYGYPALTDTIKDRILGANAGELYDLDLDRATAWAPMPTDAMAPDLFAAMAAARAR